MIDFLRNARKDKKNQEKRIASLIDVLKQSNERIRELEEKVASLRGENILFKEKILSLDEEVTGALYERNLLQTENKALQIANKAIKEEREETVTFYEKQNESLQKQISILTTVVKFAYNFLSKSKFLGSRITDGNTRIRVYEINQKNRDDFLDLLKNLSKNLKEASTKKSKENRKILAKISQRLEESPDLRFKQALVGLGIIEDSNENWEELSEVTLSKIREKNKKTTH